VNLFDDLPRTDRKPSGHSESYWHFYNRVGGTYWDQVRSLFEEWFGHLQDENVRKGIRGRMRSGDNVNFRSALAELYVHETLIRSGFTVTYEPNIPLSTRRPDFLADRGEESFFLEVTSRNVMEDDQGAKREAALHDALNSLRLENFFLEFDVDIRGPNAVSARYFKKEILKWLGTLDPDEVADTFAQGRHDLIPKIELEKDGWEVSFHALPVKKEARGFDPNRRPIGISGGGARWVNDRQIIRAALSDKTHAYGSMDRPFVVALALDSFDRDEETEAALYGSQTVEFNEMPGGTWAQRPGRTRDGYWAQPDTAGRSQVSGLLVIPGFAPWGIANTSPTLWVHPGADRPSPILPAWGVMRAVGGKLDFQEPEITPWDLFGLSSEWPVGRPFREEA